VTHLLRYDPTELRTAGAAFVEALSELSGAGGLLGDPDVWTELALDFWAHRAPPGGRVDSLPPRPHLTAELYANHCWAPSRAVVRSGPVSLSHLSHPAFTEDHPYGYAYWDRAFALERLETRLALACEWGGGGRPAARYGRVMLAASDLAGLDARAKAILFATDREEEHRRVLDGLAKLRLAAWDSRPWLWVDVPWRIDWSERPPRWGLLEG
jgi:hypothetical protein